MIEFEDKWSATHLLNNEIINLYSNKLNFAIERWDMDYDLSASNIKPNFMQRKALKELNRYRAVGTSRALVVAAAGSGKTYLAAFDALALNKMTLEKSAVNSVIDRISSSVGDILPPVEFEVLQRDLCINSEEYNAIVIKLRAVRKKLIKLRNEHSDANSMLAELKGISVSLDSEIKKLNAHQCPYCSSYLEDATEKRIISYSNAEDVQLLSLDLQAQVLDLEQKIKKLEDEYIEISAKLKEFEAKIDAETREVSDVLRAKNMRELLDKFKLEYGDISKQLDDVEKKLDELKSEKRKYDKKKKQINKKYSELMQADRFSFGLQEIDISRFSSIDLSFEAGGSNKPIATVLLEHIAELHPDKLTPGEYELLSEGLAYAESDANNGDYESAIGVAQTHIPVAAELRTRLEVLNDEFSQLVVQIHDRCNEVYSRIQELRIPEKNQQMLSFKDPEKAEFDGRIPFWSNGVFEEIVDRFERICDDVENNYEISMDIESLRRALGDILTW